MHVDPELSFWPPAEPGYVSATQEIHERRMARITAMARALCRARNINPHSWDRQNECSEEEMMSCEAITVLEVFDREIGLLA